MEDNKQQIEEMAKEIEYAKGSVETWHCRDTNCEKCEYKNCKNSAIAEELYEQNYRKIPENVVVLTKEEHKQWIKDCLESNEEAKEIGRTEAAREIIDYIDNELRIYISDSDVDLFNECIEFLKRNYGVKVE